MSFGENVKKARIAKGLTQSELAEIVSLSEHSGKSMICEVEKGNGLEAAAQKIVRYAKALDTDPNTLLGWCEPKKTFKVKVKRKGGVRE